MKKLKVKLELYMTLTEAQADVLELVDPLHVQYFAYKTLDQHLSNDLYSIDIKDATVEGE